MATRFALLTATLLTLALVSARSASAAPAAGTRLVVDSIGGQPHAGKPELWTGTVLRDGPRAPEVPECIAVSCDRIQVKVDLPEFLWRIRSGGVQIAIRFINGTPDDNLALAVYRDGHRIGASTAQVGTAQSVVIPEASNGDVPGLRRGRPRVRQPGAEPRRSPMKGSRRSSTIRSSIRSAICCRIWSRCRSRT